MNQGLAIRWGTRDDLEEVLLLDCETVSAPHWGWTEYDAMLAQGSVAGLRRVLFVAADGRLISGFAVGRVLDDEAEIESVVVRGSMRRQGIGSSLCRAVMDWARQEKACTVVLEVRQGSAGAVQLYGGLGFFKVGKRANYYREPMEDALVMKCELDGGRSTDRELFPVS